MYDAQPKLASTIESWVLGGALKKCFDQEVVKLEVFVLSH